ncbi:MAG: hypothetical protein AAGM38_03710 [Pseudomonadota bacterium]
MAVSDMNGSGAFPGGPGAGRSLDVASLLGETWRELKARFGFYFGIVIVVGLASLAAQFLWASIAGALFGVDPSAINPAGPQAFAASLALIGIGQFLIDMIAYGAMFTMIGYGVMSSSFGREVGFAEAFAQSLSRMGRAVMTLILQTFVVAIGVLLFVIPGIIALLWLFVAAPAAVVEELSPMKSLSRSATLTEGSRFPLLGVVVLMIFVSLGFGLLIGGASFAAMSGASGPAGVAATAATPGFFLVQAFAFFILAALNAFFIVLAFVAYLQLTAIKDGADPARVSGVFE